MTTLKVIGIAVIIFFLGVIAAWGLMEVLTPKPEQPLTADYITFNGYKAVHGGYAYQLTSLVPGDQLIPKADTITSFVAVLPAKKGQRDFWVLGFSEGKTFVSVVAITTREEFDRWNEFLQQ